MNKKMKVNQLNSMHSRLTFRSKTTKLLMIVTLGLVALLYGYGFSLQSWDRPEQQAVELTKSYLRENHRLNLIDSIKCERVYATFLEEMQGIYFFVNCSVGEANSGETRMLSVAFGSRNQIEFWDLNGG